MATPYYPLQGCLENATERQTAYAASVVKLFKYDILPAPDPSTPLSAYDAAEADYDDYAPITLTAWNNPILAPGSGYMTESPYAQFEVGMTDPVVGNLIGGAYVVDAAGKLRIAVVFDQPVGMNLAGQGIPLQFVDLFPTGV